MVQTVLNQARSYLGVRQGDARHKDLVAKYNRVRPLPVGYPMKVSDDWCAAFVTVVGDLSGAASLIGRECGVQRFIGIFKSKGIWLGVVKPRPGDVIVFDWQKNGWADHIGFVESVSGNQVTTIEGNTSKVVARRVYAYNDWRVAGYARPKYKSSIAEEVIAGKWGNGNERVSRLKKAGYDPVAIQQQVNQLVKSARTKKKSDREIALEIIRTNKWGTGETRKKRLTQAGYNYKVIQNLVNNLI